MIRCAASGRVTAPGERAHCPRRLLAGFVVALLATTALWVAAAPVPSASAAQADDAAWELFGLTNHDRAANGEGPLAMDPELVDIAQAWANHLAATQVLKHNPDFEAQVIAAANGSWSRVGENVGYAPSLTTLESLFMGSAPHRANILGPYDYVGVGAAQSANGEWWVVVDFLASPTAQPVIQPPPVVPYDEAVPLVQSAYRTFFGRPPATSELFYWVNQLMTGGHTTRQFLDALADSPAWVGNLVTQFYQQTLGRAPDADGLSFWSSAIISGRETPAQVAAGFYGSSEYFRRAGGTVTGWLTALYHTLLDRPPDAGGLAAWTGQFLAGVGTATIAYAFYQSPESLRDRVNNLYEELLGRPADRSGVTYWSGVLGRTGNDVLLAVSLASSSEYLRRAMARYPA